MTKRNFFSSHEMPFLLVLILIVVLHSGIFSSTSDNGIVEAVAPLMESLSSSITSSSTSLQQRRMDETTGSGSSSNDDEIIDENDYTLLGGTVVTRTDVRGYANLALDLRDIRQYSRNSNYTSLLRTLYTDGLHSSASSMFSSSSLSTSSSTSSTGSKKFALKDLNDDLAQTVNGTTTTTNSLLQSMIATPIYLFQLYGLTLQRSTTSSSTSSSSTSPSTIKSVANYAYDLIDKTIVTTLPAVPDTILVHSFWMYATHILFHGLYVCSLRTNADNPNYIHSTSYGMDEFIALWIGSNQEVGTSNGHSLYAWTQEIGTIFGTANETEEAYVNTQLKLLYEEGSIALAASKNVCTKESSSTSSNNPTSTEQKLWNVIVRMIQQMMVPLFQWTLYHLIKEDTVALKIYSKALIPQLVRCRPSLYKRLYDHLLGTGEGSNSIDYTSLKQSIINDLTEVASTCFHLRCQDIGTYDDIVFTKMNCGTMFTEANVIDDEFVYEHVLPPVFAGYTTTTQVSEVSYFDLDIYQMKVLIELNSNLFAKYIYHLGYNVPLNKQHDQQQQQNDDTTYFDETFNLVSLQLLATQGLSFAEELSSNNRNSSNVPTSKYYNAYLKYYNNHQYMNEQLLQAFDMNSQGESIISTSSSTTKSSSHSLILQTPIQRAMYVWYTCAFHILYLKSIIVLESTVWACHNKYENVYENELDSITLFDMTHPLDEAAAYIIGSMEGTSLGGSNDISDEYLLYGLANVHAFQFQRETKDQYKYAISNLQLIDELYSANGVLSTLSCTDLQTSIDHIIRLLHVGIFQSMIYSAETIHETTTSSVSTTNERNVLLSIQGHVLTNAILPTLYLYNTDMANTLAKNMLLVNGAKPIKDGPQIVADVLAKYSRQSLGLSCTYLGTYNNINPCLHSSATGGSYRLFVATIISCATTALLLLQLLVLF